MGGSFLEDLDDGDSSTKTWKVGGVGGRQKAYNPYIKVEHPTYCKCEPIK